MQQFLYFFPDPQGQGSFLPTFASAVAGRFTILTFFWVRFCVFSKPSVIGFAIAGGIADKIGRKWTISCGLGITFLALIIMCTVSAGFSKLLAEKLLLLDGKDISNGGSIEIRKR